jgi:outer membrane protein OmpA-like peptidoglycan-associated protein
MRNLNAACFVGPIIFFICVSAWGEGFQNLSWQELFTGEHPLHGQAIEQVVASKDTLWCATKKGLYYFGNPIDSNSSLPRKILEGEIAALLMAKEQIFASNPSGFYQIQKNDFSPILLTSLAGITAAAKLGAVWYLGNQEGLWLWKAGDKKPQSIRDLPRGEVVQLIALPTGLFIRYRNHDLFFIKSVNQLIEPITLEFNELAAPINAVMYHGAGLWFATEGAGLIGYQLELQEWRTPKTRQNIPFIYALAGGAGDLWLGSDEGIYVLDPLNEKLTSLRSELFLDQKIRTVLLGSRWVLINTNTNRCFFGRWTSPPSLRLSQPELDEKKQICRWLADLSGEPPFQFIAQIKRKDLSMEWAPFSLNLKPLENESGSKNQTQLLITGSLAGLPIGYYHIRIDCADSQGYRSGESFLLLKRNDPEIIKLQYPHFYVGNHTIRGTYPASEVKTMRLQNYPIAINLLPEKKEFYFQMDLSVADKIFIFNLSYNDGQQRDVYVNFDVSPAPDITLAFNQPYQNKIGEHIEFTLKAANIKSIQTWDLQIFDKEWKIIKTFSGRDQLPVSILWPWQDWSNELSKNEEVYFVQLLVKDDSGYISRSKLQSIYLGNSSKNHLTEKERMAPKVEKLPWVIEFAIGSFMGGKDAQEKMQIIANHLKQKPEAILLIQGHTHDMPGRKKTPIANKKFSIKRSEYIAEQLHQVYEIPKNRLIAMGFGSDQPLFPNTTASGRAKNRRVEFVMVY